MKNRYDRAIGYSPLQDVDRRKLQDLVTINAAILREFCAWDEADLILVAGAGLGEEAVALHRELGIKVAGVDINMSGNTRRASSPGVYLQRQDLLSLAFQDNTFGIAYSYHVLEHVKDPLRVLGEIARVLKPGAGLFIGFPNRNRLFSYIGTSQKASWLEKLIWNVNDYKYRIQGKFQNRFGAHAGFTENEFRGIASGLFGTVISVRREYMLLKYSRYSRLIRLIIGMKIEEVVFPSNYFICIKARP